MMINVWFIMGPDDFISVILSSQASVDMVRGIFFRQISMIIQVMYSHTQPRSTRNRKNQAIAMFNEQSTRNASMDFHEI